MSILPGVYLTSRSMKRETRQQSREHSAPNGLWTQALHVCIRGKRAAGPCWHWVSSCQTSCSVGILNAENTFKIPASRNIPARCSAPGSISLRPLGDLQVGALWVPPLPSAPRKYHTQLTVWPPLNADGWFSQSHGDANAKSQGEG